MNESRVLTGQPRRGEPLWSLQRDGRRMACELRDRGEQIGVEAQFLRDGECAHSRSFKTRALAVLFAEQQRRALERDDWAPCTGE
ncbi:MAG: hypothetical protein PVSMB1_10340 [Gemmatimonadaceae bacterium]